MDWNLKRYDRYDAGAFNAFETLFAAGSAATAPVQMMKGHAEFAVASPISNVI